MAWVQEIYDTLFDPNTICVACISHGKDSNAMLRAIKLLGLPLHRIVTSDVWATQDIPAVLPEMWDWKKEADETIKKLYGIEVEHICAMQKEKFRVSDKRITEVEEHAKDDLSQFVQVERERERESYESMFYHVLEGGKFAGTIKGFPQTIGSWCKKLKYEKVDIRRYILQEIQGRKEGRKEGSVYGFATMHNPYCRGELKNLRIRSQGSELVHKLPQATHTDFPSPSNAANGANGSKPFPKAP